jgi:nitroreductase
MEKPADNTYPIDDLLRQRWSPRAFAQRPVEHDKLRSVFEAARWAPSAVNAQPWSFIVATKEDISGYNRLFHCMPAPNQRWAHLAPVLLLTVTNLHRQDGQAGFLPIALNFLPQLLQLYFSNQLAPIVTI